MLGSKVEHTTNSFKKGVLFVEPSCYCFTLQILTEGSDKVPGFFDTTLKILRTEGEILRYSSPLTPTLLLFTSGTMEG